MGRWETKALVRKDDFDSTVSKTWEKMVEFIGLADIVQEGAFDEDAASILGL